MRGMESWSLMPGIACTLSTSDGLVVRKSYRMLFPLVGSLTICVKCKSLTRSRSWWLHWSPMMVVCDSQSMSEQLKSPATQMLCDPF